MGAVASQIANITIVYSTVYSGAHQRKHQPSALLAFVWGVHRWPVNSPHKRPMTRKMFPFDDVIMNLLHSLVPPSPPLAHIAPRPNTQLSLAFGTHSVIASAIIEPLWTIRWNYEGCFLLHALLQWEIKIIHAIKFCDPITTDFHNKFGILWEIL